MKLLGKLISVLLVILVLLFPKISLGGAAYGESPLFSNLQQMSGQELAAEMRFIIKAKQDGKYYPPERINAVEQALAKKQMEEMKNYEVKMKQEAEDAKKIEKLKEAAIEKAREELGKQYENNEEKIKAKAEEIVKEAVGADKWDKAKDMYEKGSGFYEEKLSSYVGKAQKAYDYYNKYNEAKEKNPEAPEAAKNLLGALAVTGDAMKEIGETLGESPTPLKIVGQVIQAYGEACGLGDTAAKNAWNFAHGGPNNVNVTGGSIYQQDMEKNNILDMERTPLQQFDKNIKIFQTGDGKFVAFDDKGHVIPGPSGAMMTREEYNTMQEAFTAWENSKKSDWTNLTTEELIKLASGQKANIMLKDRIWPLSDVTKDYTLDDIMNKGNDAVKQMETDTLIKEIDDMTKGTRGFFDGWTQSGRTSDIRKAFYDYLDYINATDQESYKKSDIEKLGNFKELVENMQKQGKPWKDIKEAVKGLKDKAAVLKDTSKNDQNDPAKSKLKDSLGLSKPNQSAPSKGSGQKPQSWVTKNGAEFSGTRDSGFTKIGSTNRPLPDPFALGIPVLKPNIYLYPPKTLRVDVVFSNPQNVTTSIPDYLVGKGWHVQAAPAGKINGNFDYLFYEANLKRGYFQKNVGWLVQAANRTADLEKILYLYGFNSQEKADFMEFWTKKLDEAKDYVAYPQETYLINQAMPITIEPRPESITRIWFYFAEKNQGEVLEPGSTEKITRNGFTVVEWGGMVE
ncbi:MAG: hypothetical protein WA131_01230 [Desulfitobacteriaceae bacterium]